ncbi:GNAT family N-acetyltransferase [Thioalkalivibrio paradoxus]|uniref:GNAT family N-acetyltransferase n=1 Tax=Thioalkalivibrio paradoxus TaxID=108010 RepID=UPI00022C3E83|nr:GNAT family N-acetyltransferase [Thioalkalivibrio paradoxus]
MIEAVSIKNIEEALPLIRKYQEFYKVQEIDDEKNREFFSQFSENGNNGSLFLFRSSSGDAVAFATVYFTYVSSIPARVGVMSDLYTLPAHRGKGIGKCLINHCLEFALEHGAARLQWLTAQDNHSAQKLYDSLGAKKSAWYVYTCGA